MFGHGLKCYALIVTEVTLHILFFLDDNLRGIVLPGLPHYFSIFILVFLTYIERQKVPGPNLLIGPNKNIKLFIIVSLPALKGMLQL